MTNIPNTPSTSIEEKPIYPTEWHMLDSLTHVECRQLSDDTYQLRSATHSITINTEGFNIYRESVASKWNRWLEANDIQSIPRDDLHYES